MEHWLGWCLTTCSVYGRFQFGNRLMNPWDGRDTVSLGSGYNKINDRLTGGLLVAEVYPPPPPPQAGAYPSLTPSPFSPVFPPNVLALTKPCKV